MRKLTFILFAAALLVLSSCGPKDGTYTFRLLTTNDVHGRYFDSIYVGNGTRQSLYAVSHYVEDVKASCFPNENEQY